MSDAAKPVVVGVDGSAASQGALWWAVREAATRRVPLLIAHAVSGLDFDRAAGIVGDAVRRARDLAPDLPVESVVDDVRAAGRALCHLSHEATLLVVASRRVGGLTGLLLGSVSAHVAAHATCPVLVVRDARGTGKPVGPPLPVMVGVGPHGADPPATDPVLRFAFDEARLRDTHLVAVRAWRPPPAPWEVGDVTALETAQRLDLADALRPWRRSHPDVSVRQRLAPVGTVAALVDAGFDAQLLVVGVHRTPATGLRLGSVSQQVLHHAPCNVAVVHILTSTDPDRSSDRSGAAATAG
jgi:nucleotide-binding universal stress UspA family protein